MTLASAGSRRSRVAGLARRRPTGPTGRWSRSRCSGRSGRRSPRGSPARVGSGLRSSSARAVIIIPGVQKPHCRPWHSMKPCWTGSSSPSCSRPSTVRTVVAAGHRGQHRARLHRLVVQPHHAGAAVAGVAAPVRAGQAEVVAQEVHQQQAALDLAGDLLAVDGHRHLHVRPLRRDAWRTARRSARAGQLVGQVPLVLRAAAHVGDRLAARARRSRRPARTAPRTAPGRAAPRRSPGCRSCSGRRRPARPGRRRSRRRPARPRRRPDTTAQSPARRSTFSYALEPFGRTGNRTSMSISASPTAVSYGPRWNSSIVHDPLAAACRGSRSWRPASVHTADRSSDGSAWHSEPPSVPRLRTTGSAITRSASREDREGRGQLGGLAAARGAGSSRRSGSASARRRCSRARRAGR